jgi:hypothetical protein
MNRPFSSDGSSSTTAVPTRPTPASTPPPAPTPTTWEGRAHVGEPKWSPIISKKKEKGCRYERGFQVHALVERL